MSLQVAEPGSPSLEKAGATPFEEKASFFARIWWVKYGNVKIEKEICFMGRRMPTRSRSFVVRWSLPLKDFVNAVLVKASKDGTEMKTQMLMGGIQSSTSFLQQSNKRTKHRMPKADRTVGLVHFCCVHSVPPTRQLEQLEHFCLDLRETLEDWLLLVWEWCDDLIVKGVTTSSYFWNRKTHKYLNGSWSSWYDLVVMGRWNGMSFPFGACQLDSFRRSVGSAVGASPRIWYCDCHV